MLVEACAKFAEAIKHKPDKHESWYNWGVALADRACLVEGDARAALLVEACAKFAGAIQHKPDEHEAWYAWGAALGECACLAEERDDTGSACRLFHQALEKFKRAGAADLIKSTEHCLAALGCTDA